MKRLSILLITTLILSLLAGCSQGDYTLLERGGNYYIRLNRSVNGSVANDNLSQLHPSPELQFSSLAEMKNDIQSGNFTQKELDIIATFDRDDSGQIQICNIDKLYEPVLPSILSVQIVDWYGDGYSFRLASSDSDTTANFTFQNKEFFDENVESYTNFEADNPISATSNPDGSNTYEYISGAGLRIRIICRNIQTDTKQLFVVEIYRLDESDTIPHRYKIFGHEHGKYYYITPRNLNCVLTLDQLSQFGIREYVETVTE